MSNKIQYLSKPESVSMADDWFDLASEKHFWMQWRFNYISKYIDILPTRPHKILEIGCGSGIVMKQFENIQNLIIDGCDLNEVALNKVNNVSGDVFLYNIYDINDKMTAKYDAILLLDVIEHINNDKNFINEALKHISKNGLVIINVPALKSLYSKYDVEAGHLRRYTKRDLSDILKSLDLEIIDISYWGILLLPIAYLRKFILIFKKNEIIKTGFNPPNRIAEWGLKVLMKIEFSLINRNVLGTSLIAIAKKNEN